MSSKLDYLSKYYDDSGKRSKKNKKKKKKESRRREVEKHDDEDDVPIMDLPMNGEDEEDENDGPVVVETTLDDAPAATKGKWEDVSAVTAAGKEKTRKRHDSFSDESEAGRAPRRRRHDSDDEENNEQPHKSEHDSLSEQQSTGKRRKRHDSSSEEAPSGEKREHRRRHDSSPEDDDNAPSRQNRRRHDSFSGEDEAPSRHRRHDSDDSSTNSRERMSSGHAAGLQNSADFAHSEAKLRSRRRNEAQAMADKYGHEETVYRDSSGRRKRQANHHQDGRDAEVQQRSLNTGRVQKDRLERQKQEMAHLQQSSFARHVDDDRLETLRKSAIRAGDPMATKAPQKQQGSGGGRLVYKGPPAKPNRFGIRPGFRWDGVDRGNGFEDKLLAKRYSKNHQSEQAYRWSTADM